MNQQFTFEIERLDDYKFNVKFDKESMGEMVTDETEEVGGNEEGPNPGRLLAASTLNCLMASLVFCLKKKKVDIGSMKGEVTTSIDRVDKKLRITQLDVAIDVDVEEEQKLEKCVDIFEDYCIVTQSIREGVDVNVEVER